MLRRHRPTLLVVTLVLLRPFAAMSQERETFEITSVRINLSGEGAAILRPHPDGAVTITNHSLIELMEFAFDVRSDQIVGTPAWATTRRFDILAKGGPNRPGAGGQRESSSIVMKLRSLLEDRFGLRVHQDMREAPVFELMVRDPGRLGPQLTASAGCDASAEGAAMASGKAACGLLFGATGLRGTGVPMGEIANVLGFLTGRTVIDRTGLTGLFDVQMTFRPEAFQTPPGLDHPTVDPDAPSLFTAIQEQLGLRLHATRGPVPTIVVDAARMPSPN